MEAEKRKYTACHVLEKFPSVCFCSLFAEEFMGRQRRGHTLYTTCQKNSPVYVLLFSQRFSSSAHQSQPSSSSSTHCIDMIFLPPSACFPVHQKKSTQNTAINLTVTCLLYFREIRKNSRRITWRPRFKPQLCH